MVRWPAPVPESLLARARTPAPHAPRCTGIDLLVGPRRYRWHSCGRHFRRSRTTLIGPMQCDPRQWPNYGRTPSATFVPGRRHRKICDSSPVRTHAQSRAELESPRARVPFIAGCEISLATALRRRAQFYRVVRYPAAYGPQVFERTRKQPVLGTREHESLRGTQTDTPPSEGTLYSNVWDETVNMIHRNKILTLQSHPPPHEFRHPRRSNQDVTHGSAGYPCCKRLPCNVHRRQTPNHSAGQPGNRQHEPPDHRHHRSPLQSDQRQASMRQDRHNHQPDADVATYQADRSTNSVMTIRSTYLHPQHGCIHSRSDAKLHAIHQTDTGD